MRHLRRLRTERERPRFTSSPGEDLEGVSDREAGDRAAAAVEALADDIAIPSGLAELGVERDDVPRLAEKSEEIQRLLVGNPRRTDREALERILESAY